MTVYHGSRDGRPLAIGDSHFGGGLWCAKDPIFARDYTPSGRDYRHVYTVLIPDSARRFSPADPQQLTALAEWMEERYPGQFSAADLAVEDLQTHSPYDSCEAQEGLEALGYDLVETACEVLILNAERLGVIAKAMHAE